MVKEKCLIQIQSANYRNKLPLRFGWKPVPHLSSRVGQGTAFQAEPNFAIAKNLYHHAVIRTFHIILVRHIRPSTSQSPFESAPFRLSRFIFCRRLSSR